MCMYHIPMLITYTVGIFTYIYAVNLFVLFRGSITVGVFVHTVRVAYTTLQTLALHIVGWNMYFKYIRRCNLDVYVINLAMLFRAGIVVKEFI